jgi:hypothetical protein
VARQSRRTVDGTTPALARVAEVVWPDGQGGHRLAFENPAGGSAERYLVLPSLQQPRFLLPLDAPPAARAQLLLRYNHLRSDSRRAVRTALAGAVRLGLPLPRQGYNLAYVAPGGVSLLEVVATGLGAEDGDLVLSTGVRARTGAARPTLNVTDQRGRARAFVKVAVTAPHRAALEREHDFLADFAARPAEGLLVPRPLFRTEWQGALVVGVEALPDDVRRIRSAHRDRVLPWLERLVSSRPRRTMTLAESPWLADLRVSASTLPEPWRDLAVTAVDRAQRVHGARAVQHGVRHGDWSPWNMAWTGNHRLALWDWEYAQPLAPRGLDEWNWQYAHDTSVRRMPVRMAAARLRASGSVDKRSALACELMLLDMAMRRAGQAAMGNRSAAHYAADLFELLDLDLA